MTCSPIIVALDFPNSAEAVQMLAHLDPSKVRVKVGNELFTRAGPDFVRYLVQEGYEVFLDLKYHDIPNTVHSALLAAQDLGIWMTNVHASGGLRMLQAARSAIAANSGCHLIAVTALTSLDADDVSSLCLNCPLDEYVATLANNVSEAGLDGVVCSAAEAPLLRQAHGAEFLLVTPGVRPASAQSDDQRRTLTPAAAMAAGASYLVIGRPITAAEQPAYALDSIIQSLKEN